MYFSLTTKECQRYWGNCYVTDEYRQFCAMGPNGQQDPDFDPNPEYEGCVWDNRPGTFLRGHTSLGYQSYDTLDGAQRACLRLDENDCGGVTFTTGNSGYVYELRRSTTPEQSPNPSEESWLRPSKYNPPISCPEKATPTVTSCMGDSGGPLIMKGLSTSKTAS